jgi:hypothetical protein
LRDSRATKRLTNAVVFSLLVACNKTTMNAPQQQQFDVHDVLAVHTSILEKQVKRRLKPVHRLGKRRITLDNFPRRLFATVWPDLNADAKFDGTHAGKMLFSHRLAPIISPLLLTRITNSHNDPNCRIPYCVHQESIALTTPSRISYNTELQKLIIHCQFKKQSFSGFDSL